MRGAIRASFVCALLLLIAVPAKSDSPPPGKPEHPAEVALLQDDSGWKYVQFPSNLRLYVFDKDAPGKPACNLGCDGSWPPLVAPADAKPLGDWTTVARYDGRKQWAYKGRPVYLRFHDTPDVPTGNGMDGVWHFLEP